jgi:hypothetical protein
MTKLLFLLALLATAARADIFEQLPILHSLDESAILAGIDKGGSFTFEADNFGFELFADPTELFIEDTVRIFSYRIAVFLGPPYFPGIEQITIGAPLILEMTFKNDGEDFRTITLPPFRLSDENGKLIALDTVGVTSASGYLYGGRATIPEPASIWLLALGCALWNGLLVMKRRR